MFEMFGKFGGFGLGERFGRISLLIIARREKKQKDKKYFFWHS